MKFLDKTDGNDKAVEDKSSGEKSLDNLHNIVGDKPAVPDGIPEITIEDYLKAGYSLIYIRTEEDHRAISIVKKAVESIDNMYGQVTFAEWRSTTGLLVAPTGQLDIPENASSKGDDPAAALKYVQNKSNEPHVVCMHNMRTFLQIAPVIQQLKDTAFAARLVGSHIILIGASIDIPPELQNLMTVYDLDLPSQEMFVSEFKILANAYKSSLKEKATTKVLKVCAASAVGMTLLQGENAIALGIAKRQRLDPGIIQIEKEQAIKRSDVLEFVHDSRGMDHLGGFKAYKLWIDKRKDSFGPEAEQYGLKFPKGVLVVGIPGTGKSLAAKVTANYFGVPLLKLDMGRVFKSLVGSSEASVRSALKTAEAVAPAVLWIEEIEKSMAGSQSSGSTDSGTTARVMSTILTWMQENTKPIFLTCTANNVESLPPELLRKGRFSEIWGAVEPQEDEREEIWNIHLGLVRKDRLEAGEFDVPALIQATGGYTGAEIEGIVEEAMFDAWSDKRREMTTDDLLAAIKSVIPQSVMCSERIDVIRSWMKSKARFVSAFDPHVIAETKTDRTFRKIREHTASVPSDGSA